MSFRRIDEGDLRRLSDTQPPGLSEEDEYIWRLAEEYCRRSEVLNSTQASRTILRSICERAGRANDEEFLQKLGRAIAFYVSPPWHAGLKRSR